MFNLEKRQLRIIPFPFNFLLKRPHYIEKRCIDLTSTLSENIGFEVFECVLLILRKPPFKFLSQKFRKILISFFKKSGSEEQIDFYVFTWHGRSHRGGHEVGNDLSISDFRCIRMRDPCESIDDPLVFDFLKESFWNGISPLGISNDQHIF